MLNWNDLEDDSFGKSLHGKDDYAVSVEKLVKKLAEDDSFFNQAGGVNIINSNIYVTSTEFGLGSVKEEDYPSPESVC